VPERPVGIGGQHGCCRVYQVTRRVITALRASPAYQKKGEERGYFVTEIHY